MLSRASAGKLWSQEFSSASQEAQGHGDLLLHQHLTPAVAYSVADRADEIDGSVNTVVLFVVCLAIRSCVLPVWVRLNICRLATVRVRVVCMTHCLEGVGPVDPVRPA